MSRFRLLAGHADYQSMLDWGYKCVGSDECWMDDGQYFGEREIEWKRCIRKEGREGKKGRQAKSFREKISSSP